MFGSSQKLKLDMLGALNGNNNDLAEKTAPMKKFSFNITTGQSFISPP